MKASTLTSQTPVRSCLVALILALCACGLTPRNQDYVAAKNLGSIEAYQAYLDKYPDNALAKAQLNELLRKKVADDAEVAKRERAAAEEQERSRARVKAWETNDVLALLNSREQVELVGQLIEAIGTRLSEADAGLLTRSVLPATEGFTSMQGSTILTFAGTSFADAKVKIGLLDVYFFKDQRFLFFGVGRIGSREFSRIGYVGDRFYSVPQPQPK